MVEKNRLQINVRVRRTESPDPGGNHENFSTRSPPQGQMGTTTPAPEDSNTGAIVTGILVPIILIGIGLLVFYIWYRRKYPVRMVIGKDFSKFSNPKYNKRGSTMTLVRNDAEAAWEIPDSPKQREHSLSLVKENETDVETEERKAVQKDNVAPERLQEPATVRTEVNIGVEIAPPPRNIVRERPKKAKLVKAIELTDDLSESAFEIFTESDLGKRTDSDLSSGNDSTETHTISLSFKETFDDKHRNTVSVVSNNFETGANERAEQRANSLPLALKGHADIHDSDIRDNRLSKSTGSEISPTNIDHLRNVEVSEDKMKVGVQNSSENLHEISPANIKATTEIEVNPSEISNNSIDGSYTFISGDKEITCSDPANNAETVTEMSEPVTNLFFPQNSDGFVSVLSEEDKNSTRKACVDDIPSTIQNKEIVHGSEESVILTQTVSDKDICVKTNTSQSNPQFKKPNAMENDIQQITSGPNNTERSESTIVFHFPDIHEAISQTEELGPKKTAEISVHRNELVSARSTIDPDSSENQESFIINNATVSLFDVQDSSKVDTKKDGSEKEPKSIQGSTLEITDSNTYDHIAKYDGSNSSETKKATLTINSDNLFLDAPPTPMIIVRDSYIHEPENVSPILLDRDTSALPVIKEKSESQSSTRSNSFEFDFVVRDFPTATNEQGSAENSKNMTPVEMQDTLPSLQSKNENKSEQCSTNLNEKSDVIEWKNLKSEGETYLTLLDSDVKAITEQNPFDSEDILTTNNNLLISVENDNIQCDDVKGKQNVESNITGSRQPAEMSFGRANDGWGTETNRDNSLDDLLNLDVSAKVIPEAAPTSVPLDSAVIDKDRFDAVSTMNTSNKSENLKPLEIEITAPKNQPQLLNFEDFEADAALLVSPVDVSTNSSDMSWEILGETSPNNEEANPFLIEHENEPFNNQVNKPDSDLTVDTIQQQSLENTIDIDVDKSKFSNEERKTSDSSSSREGDISWEVIDESVDAVDKHTLSGLDETNDTSFA